jgi:hypothetical protein
MVNVNQFGAKTFSKASRQSIWCQNIQQGIKGVTQGEIKFYLASLA